MEIDSLLHTKLKVCEFPFQVFIVATAYLVFSSEYFRKGVCRYYCGTDVALGSCIAYYISPDCMHRGTTHYMDCLWKELSSV